MKNRWLIALSAVGIHVCIGSVYAWSKLNAPIQKYFGLDTTATATWAFTIAIFFLGISAAFLGTFVERRGPRLAGQLSALFFGGGLLLSGLGVLLGNFYFFCFGYGVVGGVGLGIGYIAPVSTLIKWFPDHRGLATGMAIMGFGFGAFIATYLVELLLYLELSLPLLLSALGLFYGAVIFASARYLAPPPEDWSPAGYHPDSLRPHQLRSRPVAQMTVQEAVRRPQFYILWTMLFINISCGIGIIAVAKDMAKDPNAAGLSEGMATLTVALMSIFNGCGRIGWSALSDRLGRPVVWILFFLIQIAAFYALGDSKLFVFQLLVFLVMTCYGGGFASVPAYISDLFGTKQVSAIHGRILTAWAMAGIVGPQIIRSLKSEKYGYDLALLVYVGMFGVALLLSIVLAVMTSRMRKAAFSSSDESALEALAEDVAT